MAAPIDDWAIHWQRHLLMAIIYSFPHSDYGSGYNNCLLVYIFSTDSWWEQIKVVTKLVRGWKSVFEVGTRRCGGVETTRTEQVSRTGV